MAHWYRNWVTSEPTFDVQLTEECATSKFEVWGWMQAYSTTNYSTVAPTSVAKSTAPVQAHFVFETYVYAKGAGTLDIESIGGTGEDDDAAISVAAYAGSAIAALAAAALTF